MSDSIPADVRNVCKQTLLNLRANQDFRGDCAAEKKTGDTQQRDARKETRTMKNNTKNQVAKQINGTVEIITPEMAKVWLEKNIGNRPLHAVHVKRLADAITSNQFVLTHQGVAFDSDGTLIDGQHRLSAIVQANKAVQMLVFRGLPTATREKIDNGKPRNVANVLSFRFGLEASVANNASAMLHVIYQMLGGTKNSIGQEQLVSMYTSHQSGFEWAVRHARGPGKVPTGILAALVWAYPHAPKQCEYIAEKYRKPTYLKENSPIIALQSAAHRSDHSLPEKRTLALKTLQALEAVLDNAPLARFREASTSPVDRLNKRFGVA